jgi:8-oxo-dGTP diphosphatase
MTPPVLVVAAALVDDLDSPTALLAARRRQPVSLAGRWEFPGGKVEPGEDPEAALHRCWRLSDRYVMRLWLAAVAEGEPEPLVEHDALLWLPRGEWLTVPWLDADVRIVSALAAATETGDRLPDPR